MNKQFLVRIFLDSLEEQQIERFLVYTRNILFALHIFCENWKSKLFPVEDASRCQDTINVRHSISLYKHQEHYFFERIPLFCSFPYDLCAFMRLWKASQSSLIFRKPANFLFDLFFFYIRMFDFFQRSWTYWKENRRYFWCHCLFLYLFILYSCFFLYHKKLYFIFLYDELTSQNKYLFIDNVSYSIKYQ